MSNCFRTSDNKYKDAPPRMADGRHFTDYRPSCDLNNDVRRDNQIVDSFESRLFLQRNANQLMNINRNKACDKNCSSVCAGDVVDDVQNEGFTSTMLPELNKQICNDTYCEVVQNNLNGLGTGRHYFNVEQEEEYEKNMSSVGDNYCGGSNSFLNNYYSNINNKEGFMDNGNENNNIEREIKHTMNTIKELNNKLERLNTADTIIENNYTTKKNKIKIKKDEINSKLKEYTIKLTELNKFKRNKIEQSKKLPVEAEEVETPQNIIMALGQSNGKPSLLNIQNLSPQLNTQKNPNFKLNPDEEKIFLQMGDVEQQKVRDAQQKLREAQQNLNSFF